MMAMTTSNSVRVNPLRVERDMAGPRSTKSVGALLDPTRIIGACQRTLTALALQQAGSQFTSIAKPFGGRQRGLHRVRPPGCRQDGLVEEVMGSTTAHRTTTIFPLASLDSMTRCASWMSS